MSAPRLWRLLSGPGPLTLVLPIAANGRTCELARAGLATIAVRVPSNGHFQAGWTPSQLIHVLAFEAIPIGHMWSFTGPYFRKIFSIGLPFANSSINLSK